MKKLLYFLLLVAAGFLPQAMFASAGNVRDTNELLNHPEDIVYDQTRKCCYITNYLGNNVLKRDSLGKFEIILDTIQSPMVLALINDTLIVSSNYPSMLTVLNLAGYEKIWEISVPEALHLAQIDIDPRNKITYIMEQQGMVIKFNYNTGNYNIFVPLNTGLAYGSQSVEVDTILNRLLVFKWPAGYIRAINLSDSTQITNAAPQGTSQITASFSGPENEIYVSCWLCGCIYRYNADLSGGPEEVAGGQCDPAGFTLDFETNTLYICNYTCNTIEVVHLIPTGNYEPKEHLIECAVFPNPAKSNISLELNLKFPGDVFIVVTDLQGREVIQSSYSLLAGDHRLTLPIEILNPGTYLITLKDRIETILTKKLIIKQ